jgi:peroxiredoxin (alkyl hydroperoxide reductase subunit C)
MSVLVGKEAPDFTAQAVKGSSIIEEFSLSSLRGKYVVLWFYPLDFTFVCPTELHAFQEKLGEFEKRNTEVIAVSVDSPYTHLAWLNTPAAKGGIEGVEYTLVADLTKSIAADYDVLVEGGGVAYRGLFLIDSEGVVRHQVVNDLPLGRSVDEAIRVVDALQFVEEHGEVCPANWQPGGATIKPDPEGSQEYFGSEHA